MIERRAEFGAAAIQKPRAASSDAAVERHVDRLTNHDSDDLAIVVVPSDNCLRQGLWMPDAGDLALREITGANSINDHVVTR